MSWRKRPAISSEWPTDPYSPTPTRSITPEEDFILHFKNKYSNTYPLAWMLVDMLSMGIVTSIHENIKSNPLKKDYGVLWSIRSRFHFVADSHNPYKKFLLSSYKGIKQAVRHQSDGSPEDAIPLDKRYDITTQDILWNLHHLVVYQHYIAGQRYETAFPKVTGLISEILTASQWTFPWIGRMSLCGEYKIHLSSIFLL